MGQLCECESVFLSLGSVCAQGGVERALGGVGGYIWIEFLSMCEYSSGGVVQMHRDIWLVGLRELVVWCVAYLG